jgi:N-acetylglucosamine malate deacetylase 1
VAVRPEVGLPAPGRERPTILVVGAHAFDAEAMSGGLVASWARAGGAAFLVHVTLGEAGHAGKGLEAYAAQKRDEALRAARTLGAEAVFLDHADTDVAAAAELPLELARVVQETRPATVVTHWRGSWHADHLATHDAVLKGLVLAGLGRGTSGHPAFSPDVVMYAENWEDTDGFHPLEYRDITDGFETWLEALGQYEIGSERPPGFPYRDYYSAMARARGCLYGTRYAEAFFPAPPGVMAGLGARRPRA